MYPSYKGEINLIIGRKLFVVADEMAERGRGWVVRMPGLFCERWVRWNSPYINHFLSPDTIIPDQTNLQSWNRYSYVNNNPLRYTDPTGHRACGDGEEVTCGGHLTNPTRNAKSCSGEDCHGKGGTKSKRDRDKLVDNLNNLAVATQDIATVIDGGFAVVEVSLVAAGCAITSEAGCIEGAAAGLLLGQATFNIFGGNGAETGLSLASLVFTAAADVLEDNEFGEATTTSLLTFGAGGLMLDPIGDLAIDGYASGYNHGIFNGIETILNGGPLFH